jgi:putrescine transport system substrate-binding protein
VVAASSEVTGYANANKAATALMPKSITDNPSIYPPPEVRSKFYTVSPGTSDQVRERARLWTAMKAGR